MKARIVEVLAVKAGHLIRTGRAWHRQIKLQQRLNKPRGGK